MRLTGIETLFVEDPRQTDNGIQFIDRSVGVDSRRILGHSLAADQSGFALVAGARVHFGDANHYFNPFVEHLG